MNKRQVISTIKNLQKGFFHHRNYCSNPKLDHLDNGETVFRAKNMLIFEQSPKIQFKYPLIWLRDNCQCDKCFHKKSSSRTINWEKFSIKQDVKDVQVIKFLKLEACLN